MEAVGRRNPRHAAADLHAAKLMQGRGERVRRLPGSRSRREKTRRCGRERPYDKGQKEREAALSALARGENGGRENGSSRQGGSPGSTD